MNQESKLILSIFLLIAGLFAIGIVAHYIQFEVYNEVQQQTNYGYVTMVSIIFGVACIVTWICYVVNRL